MQEENKEPRITQPTGREQREYASARDDDYTTVAIPGTRKKYRIWWLKNGQLVKLSRLLIKKHDDDGTDDKDDGDLLAEVIEDGKLACKAAAVIVLHGYWRVRLKYWFLWRWFYYIRQYDCSQLQGIIDEGKKKVPWIQFYAATMSLTEARGTLMNMTMREAEAIRQGLLSAHGSQTESSSNGSTPAGTSSSGS